jgi:hypothetical protein
MNTDMLTNILLVLSVAVIAYLLGERRAMRREAAEAAAARERPAPEPAVTEPVVTEPVVTVSEDVPPTSGRPSGGPGLPSAKPPTLAPPLDVMPIPRSGEAPRVDVAKLEYEEDAEVDPTTVGAAASAPASKRTIYSPPVTKIVHDPGADLAEAERAESLIIVKTTDPTDK